ncbi:GAF domain-containing protein [Paenibacillus turpanensis]|uniref:GAF domain-containing protein n=1 Tax=Paenibacillus turpanensis TaxID=2689078 RepID=UPI001407DD0E|nr:GAF domain-containing protein [Paenibacillus turpanensis]
MDPGNDVIVLLSGLKTATNSDFAGIAWRKDEEGDIVWKYVLGNRNDRYKRMVKRHGQGVVGLTMRHGRPMVVTDPGTSEAELKNSPILLAEGLLSAVTAPIMREGRVVGVLLLGRRTALQYEQEQTLLIEEAAGHLHPLADPAETLTDIS